MNLHGMILIVGCLFGGMIGCGDGGSRPPADGSRPPADSGARGYTPCGAATCQPGQFCDAASFCETGCLSDANCASNQVCDTDNPNIAGVSQCINVSSPDAGPTDTGVPPTGDCAFIARRAVECGEIAPSDEAAAQVTCETELSPSDAALAARCVTAAGADCAQVSTCLGGGTSGSCSSDTECDQAPSLLHEICSGGFCILGCRLDTDCGADYVCETTVRICTPG